MDSQHGVSSGGSWFTNIFSSKDQSVKKAKAQELQTKMKTLVGKMEAYTEALQPTSGKSVPEAHELINTIVDVNHTSNEIKSEIDQINKKMKSLWVRIQPNKRNELKQIRNMLTEAMELGGKQDVKSGSPLVIQLVNASRMAVLRALDKGDLFNKLENSDASKMMMKLNFCRNLIDDTAKFDKALLEYVAKQDRPEEYIKHFPNNIKFPQEYAEIGDKFNNLAVLRGQKHREMDFNKVIAGFGEKSAKVRTRQLQEQIDGNLHLASLELKKINKDIQHQIEEQPKIEILSMENAYVMEYASDAKALEEESIDEPKIEILSMENADVMEYASNAKTLEEESIDEPKVEMNSIEYAVELVYSSDAKTLEEDQVFDQLLDQLVNTPPSEMEEEPDLEALSEAMDTVIDEEHEYFNEIRQSLNTNNPNKLLRIIGILDEHNNLSYYMGGLEGDYKTQERVEEFRQGLVNEILTSDDREQAIDDFIEELNVVMETKAKTEAQSKPLTPDELNQIPEPEINPAGKRVNIDDITEVGEYNRQGGDDSSETVAQKTEQAYSEYTVEQKQRFGAQRSSLSPGRFVGHYMNTYLKSYKENHQKPDFDLIRNEIMGDINTYLEKLNLDQNEIHLNRFQQELESQIIAHQKTTS